MIKKTFMKKYEEVYFNEIVIDVFIEIRIVLKLLREGKLKALKIVHIIIALWIKRYEIVSLVC